MITILNKNMNNLKSLMSSSSSRRSNVLSKLRPLRNKSNHIHSNMTEKEISEFVSEKLISVVNIQFESIKGKFKV